MSVRFGTRGSKCPRILAGIAAALVASSAALAQPSAHGPEFQANTYTTAPQWRPDVAADGQGNFVVSWWSDGSSGSDTSAFSIQGQRYDALFRDGVETGDTSRWSAAIP